MAKHLANAALQPQRLAVGSRALLDVVRYPFCVSWVPLIPYTLCLQALLNKKLYKRPHLIVVFFMADKWRFNGT